MHVSGLSHSSGPEGRLGWSLRLFALSIGLSIGWPLDPGQSLFVCINTLVDTWTQQTCQWAQNAHCTLIKYTEYTPQLVAWVRAFYRPVHPESTLWVYCGWGGGCQGCLVSLSFFKCLFLNIFRISPGLPNVTE